MNLARSCMQMERKSSLALVAAVIVAACSGPGLEEVETPTDLAPYPNPFTSADPLWSPQPTREKPLEVVASLDGTTAYVSLQGIPDAPGRHVAVVDIASATVLTRIEVGSSPTGLALHPSGELLVVLNRFSNYASVISTATNEVVQQVPVDFYSIEAAFAPDGRRLYLTNRWRDVLDVWDLVPRTDGIEITARTSIEVGQNPRDLAISADGSTVAVAALTGMTVSIIDTATRAELHRISLGAPANDVALVGDYVIVATTSASTHHLPLDGPDTDRDGRPGDSTPNVNFQDLQNELAVYRVDSGAQAVRYTSDTICCKDYRDVDPADGARHGELLPPTEHWIVGGALPEQLVAEEQSDELAVYVIYSGSNELQRFVLNSATGALVPGDVWPTAGHNPHGVAISGDQLLVVHRLSETLGAYDKGTGSHRATVTVGDDSGGPFPATDAEIGELFNFVTAPFSVDGDQTCAHCHREDGNIDKAFSMPLTRYGGVGLRMTMAYRGAADTRPWFFESAMDETNFKPVMNEFGRIENFCCSDYTLWPDGAPADCTTNPPAACSEQPNAHSVDSFDPARGGETEALAHPRPTGAPSRDAFYMDAAASLMGRTRSFGDGLYFEDLITEERQPVKLNFDGLTRALGLFLLHNTRLLPNPNPPDSPAAKRGAALFESLETGCAVCHPAPTFTVSTDRDPYGVGLRVGPVITPYRSAEGLNLDLLSNGFAATFPRAELDSCEGICGEAACTEDRDVCDDLRNVYFGIPGLRGVWDRATSMLHDGRAQGLREVVCPPGHPALRQGERGFNERDGIVDSHGGTSHLSVDDIADLTAFMNSL